MKVVKNKHKIKKDLKPKCRLSLLASKIHDDFNTVEFYQKIEHIRFPLSFRDHSKETYDEAFLSLGNTFYLS